MAVDITEAVRSIVDAVRTRGDDALCEFTERWDGVRLTPAQLRVPADAFASTAVDSRFAAAFERAVTRIRRFHEEVKPRSVFIDDDEGVRMGLRWTAVGAVGLYVPGGKATYPSTLAMTAIPAQIAGVERIVVVSPPGPDGEVSPQVLLAAHILGLDEVYRVGGAQAVAALAVGTETIPRVDKIFGPGNAFVAEAKKQLYGEVGIDLLAGPSELVVYADDTTRPEWVAADLMAQAEHDESTRITLLASSQRVLQAVRQELVTAVPAQPRHEIISKAFESGGTFEVVASREAAARRINEIAPEHLSVQVRDAWSMLPLLKNAGAIFLGAESPVAVGDYYAGPNHVLPTDRTARFASCLSVEDFMKRSNVVSMGCEFLRRHGEDVEILAAGEALPAHGESVRVRRQPSVTFHLRRGLRAVTPYLLVEESAAIKLNQNESPWDVPVEVKDEVALRLRELPWNRYHQKVPDDFGAALAARAGVPSECVLMGSGSNLLLQWIFEAFGGSDARILYPAPSFSLYRMWGDIVEAQLDAVRLADDLSYDAATWVTRVRESRPSLTVLCLPNNPTGGEMSLDGVRSVAAACREVGGVLIVDEAYQEFSPVGFDRTSLIHDLDNVILLRTFSKAFSAAGMRLGYLLAPAALATELRKLVPPFHLSLFSAVLGQVLLERADLMEARVRSILSERSRLTEAIGDLPGVETLPSEANFFLVRVADPALTCRELKAKGILVRPLGKDPLLEGCVRVNVGTAEENDALLEALRGRK